MGSTKSKDIATDNQPGKIEIDFSVIEFLANLSTDFITGKPNNTPENAASSHSIQRGDIPNVEESSSKLKVEADKISGTIEFL